MLTINKLHKKFKVRHKGDSVVLNNISLKVTQGQFVSIVGPSGSGKTTFLKIIAGLDKDYSGTVNWENASRDIPIGFVFQDPVLFPWRTVLENTLLPAEIDKSFMKSDLAQSYLEDVGLGDDLSSYPSQLSGGMKARVAIARAFAMQPRLLLMDEPFGALDEFTRIKLNEILYQIWKKTKPTILFVTHKISEAISLSDRIIVFSNKPVQILQDISVDFPRPRDTEIKYSKKFYEYEKSIYELISE